MNRIIETDSFKEFSQLHSDCGFNAFKELASEILELNNRVLNPVLRNNILCRTEVELALLKQTAMHKKKLSVLCGIADN